MPKARRLVYGRRSVSAALGSGSAQRLVVATGTNKDLVARATRSGLPVRVEARSWLAEATGTEKNQGIAAWCGARAKATWQEAVANAENPLLLVLDKVEDPRNLGACLRTAAFMGVDAVVAPARGSAPLTPVATKVAAGAEELVTLAQVVNLARELRSMSQAGFFIMGADPFAEDDVFDACPQGAVALVMGGEGKGLRRLTRECCDLLVSVPMSGANEEASLNVSVACGICLAAVNRARSKK